MALPFIRSESSHGALASQCLGWSWFRSVNTADMWALIFLVTRGQLVHSRTFSSIPGLHLLGANNFSLSCDNQQCQQSTRAPWWLSRLKIQHCHCCGSGCCCGSVSIPGLGTSACLRHGLKNKNVFRLCQISLEWGEGGTKSPPPSFEDHCPRG